LFNYCPQPDGHFGPTTIRALQQFLLSQEEYNGQQQSHLANSVQNPVDGSFGVATIQALQQFLVHQEEKN
jgi:peptidoglycan hydrolase-like protein with peptidoglycan-binding domain